MADLTITPADVAAATGSTEEQGTAGETITAGQCVYLVSGGVDAGQYKLADADALASAACVGVALHSSSDGQPLRILTSGGLNPGATATVGQLYTVSTTAGGIAPYADLSSGDYPTSIGYGTAAANIDIKLHVSGVAKPS